MDDIINTTPTIEQLLAIEACREAARRYSYGVDHLDADVMKSAYWPDGTDDHGVFVGNAWEFADRVVGSHDRWIVDDAHDLQPSGRDRTRRRARSRRGVQRELPVRRPTSADCPRGTGAISTPTSGAATNGGSRTVSACTTPTRPSSSRNRWASMRPSSARSTSTGPPRAVRSGPDAALRQGTSRRGPDRVRTGRR